MALQIHKGFPEPVFQRGVELSLAITRATRYAFLKSPLTRREYETTDCRHTSWPLDTAAPAYAANAPQMEIGKAEFYLKEFEKEVARAQGADMGRY